MTRPTVAIIGAGASGLMVADYLSQFAVNIEVYERMPTAGRKILMAGKTGLNISHAEPMADFIQRYQPSDWLAPFIEQYGVNEIRQFMHDLGIQSYIGSSGRIFPVEMKASPLLRAWLAKLKSADVQFFYRHRCINIEQNTITFQIEDAHHPSKNFNKTFDVIVLACGGASWAKLGSDGRWQDWFHADELTPLYASNVGICRQWSSFMQEYFGQALKRVRASVQHHDEPSAIGDIIITHYGMESGLIYKFNHALRQQWQQHQQMNLMLDLLPDVSMEQLLQQLSRSNKKQSLNNIWRKIGLDNLKIALLRECSDKSDWHNHEKMAYLMKHLTIPFDDFRPMAEAISCGGGIKRSALTEQLQLKRNLAIYCCGEMLDWDAPTGGYLLTACFATGQAVGKNIAHHLNLEL